MSAKDYFCPISHIGFGKTETEKITKQVEIIENTTFFVGVVRMYFNKLAPNKFQCHKNLLSAKYDVRLKTYALNELLERPVPGVINLWHILEEAEAGKFARLDKILGFIDDEGNEVEMIPIEQQQKINDIMISILKAKGLNFDEYIEETAYIVQVGLNRRFKRNRQEKKQKISKMKLKNQRKLGAVSETASTKSASQEAETGEKGSSAPIKIKTAKDFEHYRKSKRPTRI